MWTFLLLMAFRIQADSVTAPSRQPQLAAGHGQVAMTFGAGSAIYFTSSPDRGKTFAPPVKVAEVGSLALGRHRGPRLAILENAMVISAVTGDKQDSSQHAHGLPEGGNLTVWRSVDHGKTWTRAANINDVPGASREGLHAMAADAKDNLFAAWLDLREKGTRLYGARSSDSGLTWSKNELIYASPDGTVCQCCDPAVAFDENASIYVMFRNALDGSRDLYIARSTDGAHFETAQKQGSGTWKLNACPMDGGAFAVKRGQVTSAWRREGNVFLAEPGQPEKQIGAGKDVAMTYGAGGAYVAWTKESAIEFLAPNAAQPRQLTAKGAFANLVALPNGQVIAAWEADGSIETKLLN